MTLDKSLDKILFFDIETVSEFETLKELEEKKPNLYKVFLDYICRNILFHAIYHLYYYLSPIMVLLDVAFPYTLFFFRLHLPHRLLWHWLPKKNGSRKLSIGIA